MAKFGSFNSDDVEDKSSPFGSGFTSSSDAGTDSNSDLDSIFGRDRPEGIKPKGSPTITDYLVDVMYQAPAKGLATGVKGLLSIPAFAIDYAFDTDVLTKLDEFFSEGFFKIPETQTGAGDITAALVEFGIPLFKANKIAPFIPGLKGISTFTKLEEIPSIAGKAGEIAKRAGYFGAIQGVVDAAVSAPGLNETAGQQFGLVDKYAGENLRGRDKAVEVLKDKLKFGAEGAVISGAIPLLPVAFNLGSKYGLQPAGKYLGYAGVNAIRAVDYAVINPIGSLIAGTKIGAIDVPQLIPRLMNKIHSGLDVVEGAAAKYLMPAKESPLGVLVDSSVKKFKEWFYVNGGARGDFNDVQRQVLGLADVRGKKAAQLIYSLNKQLEEDVVGKYYQTFNKGTSQEIIKYQWSKLTDYFNNNSVVVPKIKTISKIDPTTGKLTRTRVLDPITKKPVYTYTFKESTITQKILDSLDPSVSKDVIKSAQELKKHLIDLQLELVPYASSKEIKNAFLENLGTAFKQKLASFNNYRFGFDPLKESKVINLFKNEILLSSQDLRAPVIAKLGATSSVNEGVFSAIKRNKGSINEIINLNEKNLNQFNKKYNVKLDIKSVNDFKKVLTSTAEEMALDIKNTAIKSNIQPESIFKNISEKIGAGKEVTSLATFYKRIEQLSKKGKTNLSDIIDYLSVPKGSEATIGGKKVLLPDNDFSTGILGSILHLNKQAAYRRFYDSLIDMNSKIIDPSKKLIFTERRADLTKIISPTRYENVFSSDLLSKGYYAKPEIANALAGTEAVFKSFYDLPIYGGLMKLKTAAQIGATVFSPIAQVRNVTGNAFIALVNGLYGGNTSLKDSFQIVIQDIFKGSKINSKIFQEEIDSLVRRGILDSNVQTQEIKKLFETASKGEVSLNSFVNNKYVKGAIDIYQGADNGWKIYADKFYKSAFGQALKVENPASLQKGTKAYDDFMKEVTDWYKTVAKEEFQPTNYLKGELKSPLDIMEDMSAYLVRNTMPSYNQAPKVITALRNLPIGNFVTFPQQILTNGAKIIAIGARELTSANPLIRQMGARRLMGATAGFGGLGYTIKKSAEMLTGVDENKMEAFQRSFAAPYQKNSTLIPISAPDANGNFKYYNFSYTNPYDTLVRPVNAVLNAFADGTLRGDTADKIVMDSLFGNSVTGRIGAISEIFTPFIGESIATERINDIVLRGGNKKGGGKVFYSQDDLSTRMARSIEHISGAIVPGAIKSAQRIWEGATGTFTDAGTIRDMGTEFTALTTGIRIEDAKPLASIPFIVTSYNKDKQNVDQKFADKAYKPSATVEERIGAYRNYLLESYDSQNKMFQTLKDATTIGLDEADLKEIVTGRINNKAETDSLFNGIYKVPKFNEKAFDSLIKRLETEDPRQAAKVESQIDTVKDIYKDMSNEFMGFDLGRSKSYFEDTLNRILTPSVKQIRRQPSTINVLPSGPRPMAPGIPFTYNAPNPSQTIVAGQQQQQTLGNQYNLLSSADKAKLLFGGI